MPNKVYIKDEYDDIQPCYVISGSLITSKEIYYKSYPSGELYNADSYTLDPNLHITDYGTTPYSSSLSSMMYYNSRAGIATIYANGEELVPADVYYVSSCMAFKNGTLEYINHLNEVLPLIIVNANIGYDNSYVLGNDIYDNYVAGDMPIYRDNDSSNICQLVGGIPGMYEKDIPGYYCVDLSGVDSIRYNESFDNMPRIMEYNNSQYTISKEYTNSEFNVNVVDTRDKCFKSLLNSFRNFVLNDSDNGSAYTRREVYAPYIFNQVNRTVSITHAPDICAYSVINFGDNSDPAIIYTSGLDEIDRAYELYEKYWTDNPYYSKRPPQFGDHDHWGATYNNVDAYTPRMRDYRGVHTYARDGEYTITIDTYTIGDTHGSSNSTVVSHVVSTHNVVINSQVERDIIYFKVPKEIDHMYFHGVRCILTDDSNDEYNVVALDVTGYNWLLGTVASGVQDAFLFDLPELSETPYSEYKCEVQIFEDGKINNYMSDTLEYDRTNNLFYKLFRDGYGGWYRPMDYGTYNTVIKIIGVREDNGDEIELYQYSGTIYGYSYDYITSGFYDSAIIHLRFAENTFDSLINEHRLELNSCYRGWLPILSLGAIQVAEFEDDATRNSKEYIHRVHDERGPNNKWDIYNYDDKGKFGKIMGNGQLRYDGEDQPLNEIEWTATRRYVENYSYEYSDDNQVVILMPGCIGNTYDLREVVPWRTYFPAYFPEQD